MEEKKVYVILLNYNGWEDTIECLESVLKNDYGNYQIVVVDNLSPNNSMDKILSWAKGEQEVIYPVNTHFKELSQPFISKPVPYVYYNKEDINKSTISEKEQALDNPIVFIQSGNNGGFAAGNNLGIEYAQIKDDFDQVWLLNTDTVIERNALSSILNYSNTNNLGLTSSKLIYYHTPEKIQAYGGSINKFFATASHIMDEKDIEKKLDYIVGASFLINKKVIDKIGLLPEDYFLYYEETDYCFNARNNGFKLGIDVNSIVYHKEGGSTKDPNRNVDSEFIELLKLGNRIKFHKKYLGGGVGLYLGFLIVIFNRIKRGQLSRVGKILKILFNK